MALNMLFLLKDRKQDSMLISVKIVSSFQQLLKARESLMYVATVVDLLLMQHVGVLYL